MRFRKKLQKPKKRLKEFWKYYLLSFILCSYLFSLEIEIFRQNIFKKLQFIVNFELYLKLCIFIMTSDVKKLARARSLAHSEGVLDARSLARGVDARARRSGGERASERIER